MIRKKFIYFLIVINIILLTLTVQNSNAEKKPITIETKSAKIFLPEWQQIADYTFPNLVFDKTTQQEFNKFYPYIKNFDDADENIRIFTYKPGQKSYFSSIKFGFEDEMLSWIDYSPTTKIKINDIIDVFGTPLAINTAVSKYLDYYDYGDFAVSITKDNGDVYAFTQHGTEGNFSNDAKEINIKLPKWKDLTSGKVDKLFPGLTKKSDLKVLLPKIKESSLVSQYYPKDFWTAGDELNDNLPTVYLIKKGLENSDYKSVELVFKNKILSWIDMVPKKLSLDQALKAYGNKYKIDNSTNVDFYNFKNIVLTVSKKTRTVLNIGVLGSVNAPLRNILPPIKNLDTQGIKDLKIDITTKTQFNNLLPNLVAKRQAEANIDTYKVTEGISSTDYDTVYFVFKKNKLTSVDVVPKKQLKISDIIKAYGKKYEVDNKSDKDLEYYTFKNVIVSVSKDTKIVNSMGLF